MLCCLWATLFRSLGDKVSGVERATTMDVYLSHRRDLLVVKKGALIPAAALPRSWRKRNKRVVKVSEEIALEVQARGYYMRKLNKRPERYAGL